jgi:Putative Ig domain
VTFNTTTGVLSGTPASGTNGSYPIMFTATNNGGPNTQNFTLTVNLTSAGPTASFVGSDTATQGNWQSKYGANAYFIANGPQSSGLSFGSVATQGASLWTWTSGTSDPRALAIPGGSSGIASCWYSSSSFTFDVNLTDGNTHQIALYAVDWDLQGRTEKIQIVDANNPGSVLSTQTVSSFTGGVYLVWNISGHVKINVTSNAGPNAVVSGVFF